MPVNIKPIVFSNPLKGLTKDYTGALTAAVSGEEFEYSRTNGVDPFRQGFVGHISPAQIFNSPSPITDANINSHIRAMVNDSGNSYQYLLLGGLSGVAPRVERLQSGVYNSTAAHAIVATGGNFTTIPSGTGFWGEDIITYHVSGTARVFFTFNTSTVGEMGTGTIGAGAPTYDDDFLSTHASGFALQVNVPHKLVVGPDKVLYVTNGRYLSSYNGDTDTVLQAAYDMGPGWIITDARVVSSLLVISAVNTGSTYRLVNFSAGSRICFWNTAEPGLGEVYEIPDGHVSSLFIDENTGIYAFTSKVGDIQRLRRFEDGKWKIIKEWQSSLYGTIPQPNSVDSYRGLLVWIPGDSAGSFCLAYDPKFDALHLPYFCNDGTNDATSMGVLKNSDSNNLTISMLSSGTYELARLNGSSGYASNRDFRTNLVRLPYRSNIIGFKLFFSQMASGSSATFSLFEGYDTMSVGGADDLLNLALTQAADGTIEEHIVDRSIADVSSFYMNFRLSGQISVIAVLVYYTNAIP